MDEAETLGVRAHPGGMLVERPELTVGLVRATSSPAGFEIELIARRPPDRRTALERQADIRAGRDGRAVAERRLLPEHDEGMELRFAWLGDDGRAHWSYPSRSSSSSGFSDGRDGPQVRALYSLPPMFGAGEFVLAWPEIGFPESVVRFDLPDRATVERDSRGIWQAPVVAAMPPGDLLHDELRVNTSDVDVERGRSVAAPCVLRRAEHAVVVLDWLNEVHGVLSMEISSLVRGALAGRISDRAFPPRDPEGDFPRDSETARHRLGAAIAVVDGAAAHWLHPHEASSGGGPDVFTDTGEYRFARPPGDTLDLIVGWQEAGLPEARLTIPQT